MLHQKFRAGPLVNDGTEFFRSKAQLHRAWAAKRTQNSGDRQSTARGERPDINSAVRRKDIPDRCGYLPCAHLKARSLMTCCVERQRAEANGAHTSPHSSGER
jgi:hypothetical protein